MQLLEARYLHVSYHADGAMRECGLEQGIVAARKRKARAPTGGYDQTLAMHKLGACAVGGEGEEAGREVAAWI